MIPCEAIPSNQFICVSLCVCVCLSVCVCMRERERQRGKERGTEERSGENVPQSKKEKNLSFRVAILITETEL